MQQLRLLSFAAEVMERTLVSTADKLTRTRANSNVENSIRRLSVVGLGHMGSNLAENLIADGYEVTVYDRDPRHAAPFVARGTKAASHLGGLAGCEAVLTSLPDDAVLSEVTLQDKGLIHVLASGAVHISMGTISPNLSRRLAQCHRLAGQGYVAAPVLGNPDVAHERKLFVLAAGETPSLNKVSRVLSRLGQRVFVLAEDPGTANLMKVAANALTLQSMDEVLALARKGGIETRTAFEVLTGSRIKSSPNAAAILPARPLFPPMIWCRRSRLRSIPGTMAISRSSRAPMQGRSAVFPRRLTAPTTSSMLAPTLPSSRRRRTAF
jgi:3-hydroxyisobutyrate dehydrogenase-like beta-hydroxyacid dehydrogenase